MAERTILSTPRSDTLVSVTPRGWTVDCDTVRELGSVVDWAAVFVLLPTGSVGCKRGDERVVFTGTLGGRD